MSEPLRDAPTRSRWWGVALGGAAAACLAIAAAAAGADGESQVRVSLTAGVLAVYLALFFTVVRRTAEGSPSAWVGVVATVATAGILTALVPSNAVFQFWAYPLVWTLLLRVPAALAGTFAVALAVFGGFAVSTGAEEGWIATAALTQGVSFAVNVGMGLWIRSVYVYGETRDRLLAELTAAQDELALLHREAGTTSERERLSRELHDTLAQTLTAVVLLVQRARRELATGGLTDSDLEIIEESARTALTETRTLVAGGAPIELRDGGLATALETLAERFRRETGLIVDVEVRLAQPLAREVEVALLRCAQEGLANIRKHANARRVVMSLEEEGDAAVLRIVNDGRGFDPADVATGFGLTGLHARLELMGGSLVVDGTEGAVTLLARVPRESAA